MNTNQFTQKTLEALQSAQSLAIEHQNQSLEPEHILAALAAQENGFIPQVLKHMGVDAAAFAAAAEEKVALLPRVSGSGRDPEKIHIGQAADRALSEAAKQAADACVDDAAAYALQAEGSAMLSRSWEAGGTGMRAEEETANAKYWASLAHAAAGGGVLTFCGRTGAVSPESGDYTAEQVGASPVGHIHTAADLTGGTLGGAVVAHSGAQQDLTLMQVRNISAGTADLTAGESELAEGQIYLVYEEV